MSDWAARHRRWTPRAASRRRFAFNVDAEAVGRFSESIARFLGTGRYLLWQTILVIVWIALNLFAVKLRWDPYPFILLNLAFSTQAAYAAPLILLAQNRQENRDRVSLEEDRRRAEQTKADTEYLARELAALRLAVGEGRHPRLFAARARGIARSADRAHACGGCGRQGTLSQTRGRRSPGQKARLSQVSHCCNAAVIE